MRIKVVPGGFVRISWPLDFPGYTLQSAPSVLGPWTTVPFPVRIEGNEYVVYDPLGPGPVYYRLFQ